jgi:hemerythrin-like domain-containing protein
MSATPPPGEVVDTRSMVCVHTFLRREFRLAAGLIRSVHACDTRRARIVADHLEFLTTFLHHHHAGEDRLLWPKLMARVPEELAPLVGLMQAQHEHVAALLQDIEPVRARWRSHAREADRDELARTFDELYLGLTEHLDAEEQRLLPIAARTVSRAEWRQLDAEGRNGIRTPDLPLVLGMLQYEGHPQVVADIVRQAPLLLRLIVPPLSRRAFRKHALAVHGTATP